VKRRSLRAVSVVNNRVLLRILHSSEMGFGLSTVRVGVLDRIAIGTILKQN
jgi:hypothetical protein